MKWMIGLIVLVVGFMVLGGYWESTKDPYEEGMHTSYSIVCEGGWTYKVLNQRRGIIQVLHSDGTPMKCGEKRR
jgi:hypothetical protein